MYFHFPSSPTRCTVCTTRKPPANSRRTSTALLSTNLPLPIPTDSSLTLSTFTERGTAITGLRVSQPTYSLNGATAWSPEYSSSHDDEYLLCTIMSTTRAATGRGSPCGARRDPQAATEAAATSSSARLLTPSQFSA